MQPENRNPVALAGAHRVENIKSVGTAFDEMDRSADPLAFQASYIAARYRLSPCIARLVCHLAEIGGRLG